MFSSLSQFTVMDKVFETNAIFKELSASINKVLYWEEAWAQDYNSMRF